MGTTPDEAVPAALAETQAEAAIAPEIARGATLGRYIVLDRIGAGSMGLVVTAFDPTLDRKVAIKLVRPDLTGSTVGRQRLTREAQAMAKLSHPNVVTVFEVGTVDEHVFLAMEYVAGATLDQWCAAPGRTRREIIAAYSAAGRGLAAAHKAGIVHRDFKPTNVLVSAEGQIRVADFGLATGTIDDGPAVDTGSLDDLAMTATGAVLGTPAYMAPEQHKAQAIDARSDQFAFCAALYQAVYGQLPFAGDDYPTYSTNVLAGKIRDASHPDVPARVRKAILRGLASDPAARFPTMTELLDELVEPAPARRGLAIAVIGGAIVIAAIAIAVFAHGRDDDPCAHAVPSLAGIWDPAVRTKIEQAFAATGPRGTATAQRLISLLDRRATEIGAMRRDACVATNVRRVQSEALLDRRVACLDERTAELAALSALYSGPADADTVDKSVTAVLSLPPLGRCADRDALLSAVAPPLDPQVRARARTLRDRLAGIEGLRAAGKVADLEAQTAAIVRDADALGDPATAARAHAMLAKILNTVEKYTEAEAEARRAARLAATAHDDATLAWALVAIYGNVIKSGRRDDALTIEPLVETAVVRAGDGEARGFFEVARGVLLLDNSDYVGSAAEFEAAERAYRTALGAGDPRLTTVVINLGTAQHYAGQLEAARASFERALAMQIEMVGEDHPNVAASLTSLGALLDDMGQREQALAYYQRALAIEDRVLPAGHPRHGSTYSDIGVVLDNLGRHDEALEMHHKAVAILEQIPDTEMRLSYALGNLGVSEDGAHHTQAAIDAFQRAIDLSEKLSGPDDPEVATWLHAMAEPMRRIDPARAHALLERALAIRRAKLGDSPETARTLGALGAEAVKAKQFARALDYFNQAIAVFDATGTQALSVYAEALVGRAYARRALGHPADAVIDLTVARIARVTQGSGLGVASCDYELAAVLWAIGTAASRRDAIGFATLALGEFEQAGPDPDAAPGDPDAAEVRKWLAGHR